MTRARLSLLVLAVVASVAAWMVTRSGSAEEYRITVALPNAASLKKNSKVKISGVPAGTVTSLEIGDDDTALAGLKMDPGAVPVGRDATVKIRPTDLLGERYIDLSPGDVSDALPSGSVLKVDRASLAVDLDEVVDTFDDETRARLKVVINEFGIALGGRGDSIASLLEVMPSSLAEAEKLVEQIAGENTQLVSLIERGDRVAKSVSGQRDALGTLMHDARSALTEVSARRVELGRTIDSSPQALARLRDTLALLDSAASDLRPASNDIQVASGPLTAALRELKRFERASRPALAAAVPASTALVKLGAESVGPLKRLVPTLDNVRAVSEKAVPSLDELHRRAFEDALWFIQNWSMATRSRDAIGHTIGAAVMVRPEMVYSLLDGLLGGTPSYDPDQTSADEPDGKVVAGGRSAPVTPAPTKGGADGSEAARGGGSVAPQDTVRNPEPVQNILSSVLDVTAGALDGLGLNGGAKDGRRAPMPGGVQSLLDRLVKP